MNMAKRQICICLEKEYTNSGQTLRKAVGEADRNLESVLAGIIPTRPDWQYILLNQAFYIWWDFVVTKPYEIVAGIKCNRIIYLIGVFSFSVFNRYMVCNNGAEIVKYESCPNFLFDKCPLF